MDAKWLDDFLALAESRSFTRASKLRHTSQSAMSRRIQALEQWVGAPLVNRQANPITLTPAGERFVPMATHLRGTLSAARHLCAAEARDEQEPVTLAMPLGVESGVLPKLLARLKERGVAVPLRLMICATEDAAAALRDGAADLWLAPQHARLPHLLDAAQFESAGVAQDRLSPVSRADARGRALHTLPGSRLQPVPLLEYGPHSYFAKVAGLLMASAPQPAHTRRICVAESPHSLRALVRQGMGVAFLPESLVREELETGELARADPCWGARLEISLVRARRDQRCAAGRSASAGRVWLGMQPCEPEGSAP